MVAPTRFADVMAQDDTELKEIKWLVLSARFLSATENLDITRRASLFFVPSLKWVLWDGYFASVEEPEDKARSKNVAII